MANFIVTFKIKADDNYQDRYDSLVRAIKDITSYAYWDETTSFYCFEKDTTAKDLCSDLFLKSDFNSTKDIMAVIDVSNRELATKGPLEHPSLLELYLGF